METESSAVPVSYEGKDGSLVFMTDITDRIRAEEEIRLRDEQLQQSQRMEAIGRLAGGVAHDFNNLLTAVLGYSDLILGGDMSKPEEFREDVMEIKRAAVRAKELTSQILAFSRRQPRQPKVVRANDLIRESEPLLRRTLGEDIELDYRLARDAGSIEVDPGQFTQILLNLAVNARDAMPGGGRLVVDTSKIRYEGSSWMRLTIADTGSGMDRETASRVFEPFFTTKKTGRGHWARSVHRLRHRRSERGEDIGHQRAGGRDGLHRLARERARGRRSAPEAGGRHLAADPDSRAESAPPSWWWRTSRPSGD